MQRDEVVRGKILEPAAGPRAVAEPAAPAEPPVLPTVPPGFVSHPAASRRRRLGAGRRLSGRRFACRGGHALAVLRAVGGHSRPGSLGDRRVSVPLPALRLVGARFPGSRSARCSWCCTSRPGTGCRCCRRSSSSPPTGRRGGARVRLRGMEDEPAPLAGSGPAAWRWELSCSFSPSVRANRRCPRQPALRLLPRRRRRPEAWVWRG